MDYPKNRKRTYICDSCLKRHSGGFVDSDPAHNVTTHLCNACHDSTNKSKKTSVQRGKSESFGMPF